MDQYSLGIRHCMIGFHLAHTMTVDLKAYYNPKSFWNKIVSSDIYFILCGNFVIKSLVHPHAGN